MSHEVTLSEQAGARFVELIADDNFDELIKLFTDDFVFTVATPGRVVEFRMPWLRCEIFSVATR